MSRQHSRLGWSRFRIWEVKQLVLPAALRRDSAGGMPAPGPEEKSLQLASMMNEKGLVLATDIREYKLTDLRKRARRAHLSNIQAKPWDGKEIPGKPGSLHGVLVDAPCTCTGTWRRNPDARWTMKREEIAAAVATQSEILEAVIPALRQMGVLVYATCSLCDAENEGVVSGISGSAIRSSRWIRWFIRCTGA